MNFDALARDAGVPVVTDADKLRPSETPERGDPGHTAGLLLPADEDAVGRILAAATAHRLPLVISAGRTGLVEAQRPEGELVLSLERLRRPRVFVSGDFEHLFAEDGTPESWCDELFAAWDTAGRPSLEDSRIEVEAGMAIDALNTVLSGIGRMFPMEMGSSASASVGACVANASAGANAVCYGTGAQMCERAHGYWADGTPAGPCEGPVWRLPAADELVIDSSRFDPALGLIASQGVLGVITRVELRLSGVPAVREALLLPAPDMPTAMRYLAAARTRFGAAIEEFEFMSRAAIAAVAEHRGAEFRFPLATREAPFYLLLQVRGETADDDLATPLYELAAEDLGLDDEQIGYAPLEALKPIRHSITESSNAAMRRRGGGRLSFDTATPVAVFGDYLAELESALRAQSPDLLLIAFGHAGVGGAHLHVLGSGAVPVAAHRDAIVSTVFDVTQHYGGTFSAEHGVGPKWADEFLRRVPDDAVAAMRAAKRRHDPAGILNPRSFGLIPG